MDLTIRTNCEEISLLLKQLPSNLQDKYGARGLEAAAKITAAAVRNLVPVATGLARQSIGNTRVKFYRNSGTPWMPNWSLEQPQISGIAVQSPQRTQSIPMGTGRRMLTFQTSPFKPSSCVSGECCQGSAPRLRSGNIPLETRSGPR